MYILFELLPSAWPKITCSYIHTLSLTFYDILVHLKMKKPMWLYHCYHPSNSLILGKVCQYYNSNNDNNSNNNNNNNNNKNNNKTLFYMFHCVYNFIKPIFEPLFLLSLKLKCSSKADIETKVHLSL